MVSDTGSTIIMSFSLGNFDHEIKEGVADFRKPMRHAVRDHNHVAFLELPLGASGDFLAADFAFTARFAAFGFAARHDRRGAIDHVEDIGVALMYLHLARRRDPPARLYFVAAVHQHRNTLGKRIVDLGAIEY